VFPVKGADILASGVPAGPDVGRILSGLESQWVDSNFTLTRDALLESTPN
jgi:poly(A) polymerase